MYSSAKRAIHPWFGFANIHSVFEKFRYSCFCLAVASPAFYSENVSLIYLGNKVVFFEVLTKLQLTLKCWE